MSVEKHAEAAADKIARHFGDSKTCGICVQIVQTAIDEATAPLKARIAELEGLGPLIKEFGDACESVGHSNRRNEDGQVDWMHGLEAKIDAILRGES